MYVSVTFYTAFYTTFQQMEALGINCQKMENGVQPLENGQILSLPPVLFGTLGEDESKKTLLVYGHLDVQPAKLEDGWVYFAYSHKMSF